MIYEALLALHILSLVGWAGLSTGAYLVVRELKNDHLPPSYRRVVHLEAASGALLFATGLAMAVHVYGFPRSPLWIHYALGVALIAGALEVVHVRAAYRWDPSRYHRLVKALAPAWAAIVAVMLWLMVWKPL
ncbi:MAG: hypothetical protein QXI84_08265 [Thermofilaceae archaeon]